MLSASLDGELTQQEQQRVRLYLEESEEAREELRQLQELKRLTAELSFAPPPDERLDELAKSLSVEAPRRAGWVLLSAGVVAIIVVLRHNGRGVRAVAGFGAAPAIAGGAARPLSRSQAMIIVTDSSVAGMKIVRTLGLVRGNTVRARHLGDDVMAFFKGWVGGEVHEYTKLIAESREHALDRMAEEAQSMGGNAVIDVRFSTSYISNNMAEILAYGTAVLLQPESNEPEN